MNPCLLVFGASASQPTLIEAVARFLITGVGGIIASAEGPSFFRGLLAVFSPWKCSNLEAPKRYFHHSEKSTTNKREKASVCSAYIEYTKHLQQFEIVHLQANFIGGGGGGGLPFAYYLHTPGVDQTISRPWKTTNNCKSLQTKQLRLKKTNPSTNLICLAQQVPGGAAAPLPPVGYGSAYPTQFSFLYFLNGV